MRPLAGGRGVVVDRGIALTPGVARAACGLALLTLGARSRALGRPQGRARMLSAAGRRRHRSGDSRAEREGRRQSRAANPAARRYYAVKSKEDELRCVACANRVVCEISINGNVGNLGELGYF